ncbi:outer membrane protein assembly factor BamC [Methylomicrobium sp. RS1]|jgi:outer membrane protein assembly factor BamC|uniref:outer membrane protein assembly factor BamC n=1 Tax=Candidatus Methylomicrobium oryzae TaxID=2802053 RepID=UPI00192461A7|nr:outer membrane protein assembly factor BamC [Methylomicrobium sp. RS1]MBL1264064.1 outer membrane protein assembly factor BamC [Methylomicrobium sp. RS1]
MNKRKDLLFPVVAAVLNLSACSTIQSMFPDKEKDYQFTTEIPPLVLPEDLSQGAAGKAAETPSKSESGEPVKEETRQAAETGEADEAGGNSAQPEQAPAEEQAGQESPQPEESRDSARPEQTAEVAEESTDADKDKGTPVELVRFSDGERRLRIHSSPDRAWHLVSKALSRNAIEVTHRDQDQKLFYVQYDPDKEKAEDGSLLDETIFLFKGFEANEKQYLLKLIAVDGKSDLAITDKDLEPVPDDEAAVKLLRLLGGTIQGG